MGRVDNDFRSFVTPIRPNMSRILFVQVAGDFRTAYGMLVETGRETYYGHRYVIRQFEELQRDFGEVAVLCCLTQESYVDRLPNGVHVMGAKAHPRRQGGKIRRMMAEWRPTHVVFLGPVIPLIRWTLSAGMQVACQFADSFELDPIRRFLRYTRMRSTLNDERVAWVSNHGWNACRSLARTGIEASKVLAWDWPYGRSPDQSAVRSLPDDEPRTLLYVGAVRPDKGVGDLLRAIAILKRRGVVVRLCIAGGGRLDLFRTLAAKLDISADVEFLGLVANDVVFDLMRSAAALVVPSHHSYPEGLPLVIYEALGARTPIVASDHPMFSGHLVDGQTALVFPQRNSPALADTIGRLLSQPDLFARLSANSDLVWSGLSNPIKWGDTIRRWLDGDKAWFAAQSLAVRTASQAPRSLSVSGR